MKTKLILLVLVSAFSLQPSALLAQGSLTPPGAPAPVMKTLDQINPRTPISTAPFTITNSGSYYLTTNLSGIAGTNGITVFANDVTIDLNGFALWGVPLIKRRASALKRHEPHGSQRDDRKVGAMGVDASPSYNSDECQFQQLRVFQNGIGLHADSRTVVSDCMVNSNLSTGYLPVH